LEIEFRSYWLLYRMLMQAAIDENTKNREKKKKNTLQH